MSGAVAPARRLRERRLVARLATPALVAPAMVARWPAAAPAIIVGPIAPEELGLELWQRVERALPAAEGLSPREIHCRLGGWSSADGVRRVLRELIAAGRAVREGDPGAYRYRKAAP